MSSYEIGMVGLGVMGRNLLLNMADHGYTVAGYDKDPTRGAELRREAGGRAIRSATSLVEFIHMLRIPRVVMLLVPAGPAVDSVIRDLLPHLAPGDVIVDGGNSFFRDTELRQHMLADHSIYLLGVGVSGGEHGARYGPSLMPGGPLAAYDRVRPVFEAIAARVGDEPCVAYMGPGGAGHYVKMVHNGIEYGLMQLIAETYDVMKRGLGLDEDHLHDVYHRWNHSELNAYLLEITARIFCEVDDRTGKRLIEVILDEARQKGTGMWVVQSAMELQTPVFTIAMAVGMRDLSRFGKERDAAARVFGGAPRAFQGQRDTFLEQLRNAFYVGMIITFAQGMALLRSASAAYGYEVHLEEIARIWRGGCIIRAAVLEDIRAAYRARPDLTNLLVDSRLAQVIAARQADLRAAICAAVDLGIPAPGMMSALAYFDGYRSDWLPANLIQAQRDYFGAHTYERVDAKGVFHTRWSQD
jgi:6-phosphogluconate dehydrogenase